MPGSTCLLTVFDSLSDPSVDHPVVLLTTGLLCLSDCRSIFGVEPPRFADAQDILFPFSCRSLAEREARADRHPLRTTVPLGRAFPAQQHACSPGTRTWRHRPLSSSSQKGLAA